MTKTVNLATMQQGKCYEVNGFTSEDTTYAEKLYKMGFVKGTPVELSPVKIADPIVVQIRGSRIALRKHEASQILVREI